MELVETDCECSTCIVTLLCELRFVTLWRCRDEFNVRYF